MDALASLLLELSSPDNATRNNAERRYEAMCLDPILPSLLCATIADKASLTSVRQLAAVLLRRALVKPSNVPAVTAAALQGMSTSSDHIPNNNTALAVNDTTSLYFKMNVGQQEQFRAQLLLLLSALDELDLKMKVCDTIGEFTTLVFEPGEWPELLSYCHAALSAQSAPEVEAGLRLFSSLAYASHLSSWLESSNGTAQIIAILTTTINSSEGRLIIASLHATNSLLMSLPQESDYDRYQQLLPSLMRGLNIALQQQINGSSEEETVTLSYLDTLIQIMEEAPGFFSQQLSQVFSSLIAMIELCGERATLKAARNMLLELVVTMCESAPKSVRKVRGPAGEKSYVPLRVVPLCAAIAASINDVEWDGKGEEEEEESEVGLTALSRITIQLGLRHTYPAVSAQLSRLLASPSWKDQHAGLRIMGDFLELTTSIEPAAQLAKHRADVVSTLAVFSMSAHYRVRAASYYAISQLLYYHGKDIDDQYIDRLLGLSLEGCRVAVNVSPRVRRGALQALVSLLDSARGFLERRPDSTVRVLAAVTAALAEGPPSVQELCVGAIMSLAERAEGEQIASYYDELMPVLTQLLAYARDNSMELLWGRTLECCAFVGECVGREKFRLNAVEMISMLAALQQALGTSFDGWEGKKYFLRAWVSVSRCLGSESEPYLASILSQLFTALSQNVSAGTGDLDLEGCEDRSDVELLEGNDGMLLAVRSAAIEEQAAAAQLLFLVVERMQGSFFPYVEQSVRCIVPLLTSPHDDVRSYCIAIIPEVVRCTAVATSPDRNGLKNVSEYLLGSLLKAVESEGVLELIMAGLRALKLTLHNSSLNWSLRGGVNIDTAYFLEPPCSPIPAVCAPLYSPVQLSEVSKTAKVVLRDSIQRRAILRAEAQLGGCRDDDDADDEKAFLKESTELHLNIAMLLGMLLRTYGAVYLPTYMESWHDTVLEMAREVCLPEDRKFAFLVMCDVLEYGLDEGSATAYLALSLPLLIEGCSDSSVQQLGCYGLGAAAVAQPKAFSPYCAQSVHALLAVAGAAEGGGGCDNAISALGCVLQSMEGVGMHRPNGYIEFSNGSIDFSPLWSKWIDSLPLLADNAEGLKVIRQLISLLEGIHRGRISSGLLPRDEPDATQRLVQCVCVLLSVYGSKKSSDTTTDKLIGELFCSLASSEGRLSGVVGLISRLHSDYRERFERIVGLFSIVH